MASSTVREGMFSSGIALRFPAMCAFIVLGIGLSGCGKPFNVKQQPTLPPANYSSKAESGNISLQAQALTDEDLLYDTFDANLIEAGVLAVRVMLVNSTQSELNMQKARFEIRGATSSRNFKTVNARDAFKRLVSYYEISVYNKSGYKDSLNDFSAYAFDNKSPLAAGQSRQGLVFFLIPSEVLRGGNLTLIVNKLDARQPDARLELELN